MTRYEWLKKSQPNVSPDEDEVRMEHLRREREGAECARRINAETVAATERERAAEIGKRTQSKPTENLVSAQRSRKCAISARSR